MQVSSKLLFRTAIVLLGIMLAITVFVVANSSQKAGALSGGEWAAVQTYVNDYIASQFEYGAEGEAGFVRDRAWLKSRIDSNGDMNLSTGAGVLGEGDDAANAPVLIDNLNQSGVIPGTSIQCTWNSGLGTTNCFDASKVNAVKAKVEAHAAAGFSTDIVDYCLSGHTEASTTGGWGYIAQTGGLGKGAYPNAPKVYAFKWGRNGWVGSAGSYPNTGPTGAATAPSSYADATNTAPCNGITPDSELVRCTAQWAIYNGTPAAGTWGPGSIAGGNIGNGQSPDTLVPYSTSNPDLKAGQIVDIRINNDGTIPAKTIVDSNSPTVWVPAQTVFNSGRSALNSTLAPGATGILVAGRTQMMGGIVAVGLKMLGYPMATNGFLNSGMRKWNNTMDEEQVAASPTYPTVAPSTIDNAAPTQSGVGHGNVTQTAANISRTANEPASMKIEYGTTTAYGNTANFTILKSGARTEQLTGLAPGTTYYYRVTSYDGQANASSSATGSFTTAAAADTTPPSVTYVGPTGTISNSNPTVTGTATDNVGVTSAKLNLNSGPDIACTVSGSNVSCTTSGLADGSYSAKITAYDAAGNSGSATGNFTVSTCTAGKPSLKPNHSGAFWASYSDYMARELSVSYSINNTGATGAFSVAITGATANWGVTLSTPTPVALGNIAAGGSAPATLKFHVPNGVSKFRTLLSGSGSDQCGTGYTYP